MSFDVGIRRQASKNVVGILPGSEHPDEIVLYSAHWDHLGKCDAVNGDDICNGALDNASGTAGLVALAEAHAKAGAAKRSLVFLAVMAGFGLVHTPMALLLPPVFAIGALAFAVLGMAYTSFVSNIEHFNILFTGLLTPMFLFGGVFFPFSGLPGWAQAVGWCLPLSHLVAATRDLTLGGAGPATLLHVGALLALLVVVFPFPAARLRRTLLR